MKTLEEQIRPHARYWDCYNDCPLEYNHTGKLLKITNLFAIGFAEWCDDNYFRMGTTNIWSDSIDWEDNLKHTTKELLEIYENEKGL